jgi:hypothetical protein
LVARQRADLVRTQAVHHHVLLCVYDEVHW